MSALKQHVTNPLGFGTAIPPCNTLGYKRQAESNPANSGSLKKIKATTMSASAEERLAKATALVEKDIADNKVVVYAKTWCPHCDKTKDTLKTDAFKDVPVLIRDLDVMDDPTGPCMAKALKDKTGQTSVPNIFIAGKHLGGNSDFQEALANGTLSLQ